MSYKFKKIDIKNQTYYFLIISSTQENSIQIITHNNS